MKSWLRRLRGAVGMGLTWAVGWALAGLLIGVSSRIVPGRLFDRFFAVFDAPLPALAIPGFVGGVLFSVVLAAAVRRRRFEELSLPRFALLGAVGGLLLSLVPAALAAVGLLSGAPQNGALWRTTAVIGAPLMALSAASAAASLALARRAGRGSLHAIGDATDPVLEEGESHGRRAPEGEPVARGSAVQRRG